MIRHSIVDLKILSELKGWKKCDKSLKYKLINGVKVSVYSDRYKVFQNSKTCCECGIEGKFFAIEKNYNEVHYHLNLYAINKNGKEILLTKDHIIPKSLGGKNCIKNYQTMCVYCNQEKGNGLPDKINSAIARNRRILSKKQRAEQNVIDWIEGDKERIKEKFGYTGNYPKSEHLPICHIKKLFIGEYDKKIGIKCFACGLNLGIELKQNKFYDVLQFENIEEYKLACLNLVIRMWNDEIKTKEINEIKLQLKQFKRQE